VENAPAGDIVNMLFLNSARRWGGNEKWTALAARQCSEEHGVYLAYRCREIGRRFEIPKYRLPFHHEADLITLFCLISIIKKHRIRLLIPTKRKDYALAGIASRFCGVKNVLRLGIVRDLKGKWIYRLVYDRLCDGIVVNAHSIKQMLLRSGFLKPEKIQVIYNGIDPDKVMQDAGEKVAFESHFPFLVSFLGELSARKGVDTLLRGFALFADGIKCGLIIIGDGSEKESLKGLAYELGIAHRVMFLGFRSNPYPFISQSDIFVTTSRNEGLSNALVEAMILKKPVISTRAGGVEEILRHRENGYLIPVNHPEELARALTELFADFKLRQHIAQAGWRSAVERFSLERMKSELIRYFSRVVEA